MTHTEAELKGMTVKDLKEVAKGIGASATGKKDELINAILEAEAAQAADNLDDDGLGDADDLLGDAAAAAPAAAGAAPAAGAPAAADGKHATIVFSLAADQAAAAHKKANIAGVKVLSDKEREQLRAAKFGLAPKGGVGKPAAAGGKAAAAGGISTAGGVGVGLEEEIKKLQRQQKFAKLSEKDEKKLEGLQKKLEDQKLKQRLALDRLELVADEEKLKKRQEKFGATKILFNPGAKDLKDPELMKKRAEKFKGAGAGKSMGTVESKDDDARKKARLERFAKDKQ